jgi:tetratricopeptide (TPR) repeat protein/tRNA A-37 threonylcarbamoyl transferase component Bud32
LLAGTSQGEPVAGDRLGPYRLLDLIGQGGMGDVYRAVRDDDHFKKVVALKLVRREMATEPMVARFREERQILAGLEHPGIVPLLDGGASADGRPFLVMEHVEGTRIDVHCRERGLPVRARVELFRAVCSAVQYAHQNLVVHRDLKPANILVTAGDVPKLLDFGVAKLVDPVAAATVTQFRPMTPAYASPEQFRGEALTTATDIYSLGVVLYELLAGRRPYRVSTGTPLELREAICEEEPEAPRADADLDAIVLKALRKAPSRRYATVEAFSEDLRRYLAGLPVAARKGTARYRAGKFVRRHRAKVVSSALLLVLGAGFAMNMRAQARRVGREKDKAERVTTFLVNLFRVSDPSEERGRTVTAREMLDQGTARIGTELTDEPEVRATLMGTMGRVYANLGLYERAMPLLEESLQTRRRVLGPEHAEVAASLHTLGDLLYDIGDYAGAESRLREGLAIKRKLLGAEHAEVAHTLHGLAAVRHKTGDYAGAEALYREALAMRRTLLGSEHIDVARTLNNLGSLLKNKGDLAGAGAHLRESLATKMKLLGGEHLDVARSQNNLALVLHAQGDHAGAEALHRQALATKRTLLDRGHPDIGRSLNNLANVVYDRGDYTEAEALYRQSLAIDRQNLGSAHADVAIGLNNIGNVLQMKGDPAGAEALHREALVLRRELLGREHPDVAQSLYSLATALRDQGEAASAETLHREALALRRKLLGPTHADVAASLTELAAVLSDSGRWAEAEPLVREALDIQRTVLPQPHPEVAASQSVLGGCLAAAGRFAEAEPLLRESHAQLEARLGRRSHLTRAAAARVARLEQGWGGRDPARASPGGKRR